MTTTFVSDLTRELTHAANAATLAPSVHNTQPWRFHIDGPVLEIHADPARQLAVLDPTGRQLFVSLGCALFNARARLAADGVAVRVEIAPEQANETLAARLIVDAEQRIDADVAALAPALVARQTNRREFTDNAVPDALIAAWQAAVAAEGAALCQVTRSSDRLALSRLSQRADEYQLLDPAYRAELRSWTDHDDRRRDGIRPAVVPHVDGTAREEVPIRDFDTNGHGWLPAATNATHDQSLFVLCTAGDSRAEWIRAGQAIERAWLALTRAGFTASVFTQVIEVGSLRVQLQHELRLPGRPHLVFRVGKAPVAAFSRRRPLSQVLSVADDEASRP